MSTLRLFLLSAPLFPGMTDRELGRIVGAVQEWTDMQARAAA